MGRIIRWIAKIVCLYDVTAVKYRILWYIDHLYTFFLNNVRYIQIVTQYLSHKI